MDGRIEQTDGLNGRMDLTDGRIEWTDGLNGRIERTD